MIKKIAKHKYLFICLSLWLFSLCLILPSIIASAEKTLDIENWSGDNFSDLDRLTITDKSDSDTNATVQVVSGETAIIFKATSTYSSGGCGTSPKYNVYNASLKIENNWEWHTFTIVVKEGSNFSHSHSDNVEVSYSDNLTIYKFDYTEHLEFSFASSENDTIEHESKLEFISISAEKKPDANISLEYFENLHGNIQIQINGDHWDDFGDTDTYCVPVGQTAKLKASTISGYQFSGWCVIPEGASFSYCISTEIETGELTFKNGDTIIPVYLPENSIYAKYQIGEKLFLFLDDALDCAIDGDTVKVVKSGTAFLRGSSNAVTIRKKVTLLVPRSSADDGSISEINKNTAWSGSRDGKIFVYLTVPEEITLNVFGTLTVNAQQAPAQGYSGYVYGECGELILGGKINIESGGQLLAYGFIRHETETAYIIAKSGSQIKQFFEMADWPGGSNGSSLSNGTNKVFPLNQYYLANIQVPVEYQYGSKLIGRSLVNLSNINYSSEPTVISDSNALFILKSGSIIMDWDNSNSKSIISINGKVEFKSVTVRISGASINSETYILALSGAYDVYIESGASLDLTKDVKMLPGSRVTIRENGSFVISKGASLYLYARDDLPSEFCFQGKYRKPSSSCKNASTMTNFTQEDDACIVVEGELIVNGSIYSSGSDVNSKEYAGGVIAASSNAKMVLPNKESSKSINEIQNGSKTSISFTYVRLENLGVSANKIGKYDIPSVAGEYYAARVGDTDQYGWYIYAIESTLDGVEQPIVYVSNSNYPNTEAEKELEKLVKPVKDDNLHYPVSITRTPEAGNKMVARVTIGAPELVFSHYTDGNKTDLGMHVNYLVGDYIWLNVDFIFNGNLSIKEDTSNRCLALMPLNGENEYMLVRQIYSHELSSELKVTFIYNGNNYEATFNFMDFEAADDKKDLKAALDDYGYAAAKRKYSNNDDLSEELISTISSVKTELDELSKSTGNVSLLAPSESGKSVYINQNSIGINFSFDNRISIMYRFKICDSETNAPITTREELLNKGIKDIGLVVGEQTKRIFEDGKWVAITASDENDTTDYGESSGYFKDGYLVITHDLKQSEYDDALDIQPYIILDDNTRIDGAEIIYGLKTYVYRMYISETAKESPDDDWVNFLCTVWNLIKAVA